MIENTDNTSRQGWKNLIIILPYFVIVGIFQLIAFSLLGLDIMNDKQDKTMFQHAVIMLFGLLGTVLIVGIFAKYIDKIRFIDIGFRKENVLKDTLLGFGFGVLMLLLSFVILLITGQVSISNSEFILPEFILSIFLFVAIAITEEVIMRGYILGNLMASCNNYTALLISSVLFCSMHFFNPHFNWISFINLILAGILIGLPYVFTKNLWFSIAIHFAWNFFQGTVLGFNVSGQKIYSFLTLNLSSNTLWNGGEFGFENSILCTLIHVIAIGLVYKIFKNRLKTEPNTEGV
jgi:uncharacterized protein